MIVKFDKNFNNQFKKVSKKKTKNDLIDDLYYKEIVEKYFSLDDSTDDDLDSVLDKFKNICMFNYYTYYCIEGKPFNEDYYYLFYSIKNDINKYIVSNKIKFLEIFYHPLNNCIIFTQNDISDDKIYGGYGKNLCDNNTIYYNIVLHDVKYNKELVNVANIIFKYKINNEEKGIIVSFNRSLDSTYDKIMPKFKKIDVVDFENLKTTINNYLNNHPDFKTFCEYERLGFEE